MHVPKAAGSTFKSILWRSFGRDRVYNFRGPTMREDTDSFFSMSEADREVYVAVQGHVPFGLHRYLLGDWRYVTLLRDPVARLISTYKFVLSNQRHPDHQRVHCGNYTFPDFVEFTAATGRLNLQSLWLSGDIKIETHPRAIRVAEQSDAEILAKALRNLEEHFALAAPIERFDDFLLCISKLFGWPIPYYADVNRGKGEAPLFSPAFAADLKERVWADRKVLEVANQRFEKKVLALGVGGLERAELTVKKHGYRAAKSLRDSILSQTARRN